MRHCHELCSSWGQPIVFPASAAETASVWQGVYTKDQAARGKARYFTACAACHGGLLQGDSDSPELAGTAFMKRRTEQSFATLFAFTTSQMPVGRPGSTGLYRRYRPHPRDQRLFLMVIDWPRQKDFGDQGARNWR
jgi:hypothetical protein